jgi:acyl-CoA thioesterase
MADRFEQELGLRALGANRFEIEMGDRWNIGPVPNGGYSLSVAAEALRRVLDFDQPLSLTGHFLRPAQAGTATIEVDTLRSGRRMGYARAVLSQEGSARLAVTAVNGNPDSRSGFDHLTLTPPELPAFEDCTPIPGVRPFNDNMSVRLDPACAGWLEGRYDEHCVLTGWVAFADGRPADRAALPLFSDSFPPPVFRRLGPVGWVPTLELTLHYHRAPASARLIGRFSTQVVSSGILEESGQLWDETGQLVARVRQLALLQQRQA